MEGSVSKLVRLLHVHDFFYSRIHLKYFRIYFTGVSDTTDDCHVGTVDNVCVKTTYGDHLFDVGNIFNS